MKSGLRPLMGRGRSGRPGSATGRLFYALVYVCRALIQGLPTHCYLKIPGAVLVYAVSQWRSSSVNGSVEFRVA